MPMPWKKVKSSRITRLVADLHNSPKHGGSLVVETGFPTSLIDLFVKNRDRLIRKTSKRRRAHQSQPQPSPESAPRPPSSPISPAETKELEDPGGGIDPTGCADQGGITSGVRDDRVVRQEPEPKRNVFMALLKVCFILVLALRTKQLTLGITLSAFALLLVEYLTARGFPSITPCPNARARMKSVVFKVFGLKILKPADVVVVSPEIVEACEEVEMWGGDVCVLKNREEGNGSEAVGEGNDGSYLSEATPKSILEDEDKGEGKKVRDLLKKERGRGAKLKSKLAKKIVPKKFRGNKKKKIDKVSDQEHDPGSDASSCISGEGDGNSNSISEQSDTQNRRETEPDLEITQLVPTEKKGYVIVVLFMIGLAGLLGGKGLAIVLILFCCLILGLTEKFRNGKRSPTSK